MNFQKICRAALIFVVAALVSACVEKHEKKPDVPNTKPGAQVKVEFSDITPFEITATFTPNDSVQNYRFIILEEGGLKNQLEQFGFPDSVTYMSTIAATPDEDPTKPYVFTWKKLDPATDWEVLVMPINWNDQNAPIQIFKVSTAILGGSGEASVNIEIGEFTLTPSPDKEDSLVGAQLITVTPNDQAGLYRFMLIDSIAFVCDTLEWKGNENTIIDYLKQDNNPAYPPQFEDPYWNLYQKDEWAWPLDFSTSYIAFGLARNADGVFGKLVRKDFSTPDSASVATPKAIIEPSLLRR